MYYDVAVDSSEMTAVLNIVHTVHVEQLKWHE
jgi:hypothetical protein